MSEDGRKNNVAVSVLQFESPQPVVSVFERDGKLDIARQGFCC
jgi:hypothetical protein